MTRSAPALRIAFFGLSITSSWGNGHATTYRSLVKGLVRRGHDVTFFERRQPWYEAHQDLRHSNLCEVVLYDAVEELDRVWRTAIRDADVVVIGSYVPEGVRLAERVLRHATGVSAFYDIDTPVTLSALASQQCTYLTEYMIPQFDLYLSFSGGPVLDVLRRSYGASRPRALFCSVDPEQYFPIRMPPRYDLAYLGTYSEDRQPKVEALLNEPARAWPEGRFCVAGAQYPDGIRWPGNVRRLSHVAPIEHNLFYNSQRFALNVTRQDMVRCGYSPSVRLFEAAACGVPVISDPWEGLGDLFIPEKEILVARTPQEVLSVLRERSVEEARAIGARARARVLREHTSEHRALELEQHVQAVISDASPTLELERSVTRSSSATVH
jgi:spore maturation protein CgeB